jgi:hypothetical protein
MDCSYINRFSLLSPFKLRNMQDYRNRYRQSSYEQGYSNESNMELDPEFELERESDPSYEMEGSFDMENQNEFESDYELQPEFEMEEEADYENEYDMESGPGYQSNEFEQQYEGSQDEMESELEYVANEQEFETWVKKVVTRDHRRLTPILRTPLGQKAMKQFSRIAFRTLPFIGRRIPGFKRPFQYRRPYYNRYNMPGYRRWHRRQAWRPGMPIQPYSNMQQPQGFPGSDIPQQPQNFPGADMSQQPQALPNTDAQQQPQIQPDGSFKNFVLNTIKNLAEQISRGNESIAALKNSITNSAVNNFPAIVQPKTDSADQPAPNMQPAPGTDPTQKEPPTTPEFEFEDYEFENEGNYQYENATHGEITDSEGSFSEETEIALASELLSINNEMELDHFLGLKLLKRAVGGFSKLLKSPAGALLKKGFLKILGKALPVIGGVVGGPAGALVGNTIGATVASDPNEAKELFELELEGLSNEDGEFEIAKAFVRFAGNAAKEAHDNETGNAAKDAELAMIRAARRFAPGLLRPRNYGYNRNRYSRHDQNDDTGDNSNMGDNGRWYRRGNKIIIQNAF